MKPQSLPTSPEDMPMSIADCPAEFWVGRVVSHKKRPEFYGHISGFGTNAAHEVILKVTWQDGVTATNHPSNVELW